MAVMVMVMVVVVMVPAVLIHEMGGGGIVEHTVLEV